MSEHLHAALYTGKIAGKPVKRMLVDTGASRTIVNSQWIPTAAISDTTLTFSPFNAWRTISVNGEDVTLELAVQNDLKYDALLGLDIPFLWNLGDHLRRPCPQKTGRNRARSQEAGCGK